jgi:hypothetical protein
MWQFTIHARPLEASPDTAGAYVSCWVESSLRDGAEVLACHYLAEEGWIPGEIENVRRCEESDYAGSPELKDFREAAEDGACFVYHCYPHEVEAEEDDDE